MTRDLQEIAAAIVDRAGTGEDVEAFVTHQREFEVKVHAGEVDSLSSAEPRGAGVRVIVEHRAGFAYSTDLSEDGLAALVRTARANAAHATTDEAIGLAGAWDAAPAEVDGLVDDSLHLVGPDEKVAFALELEAVTRSVDERVRNVEEAAYSDSDSTVAIATTSGISASFRRTDAWCYSVAIAGDGSDTEVAFEFDLARGIAGLDRDRVGRAAAQRALGILGAKKIPSAVMPVVFDPYTAAQFLGVLGTALTAEAVQKGRSLFAGRIGDPVAAPGINLVDDGRAEGAPGSAPWDGEGVPTRRTRVIGGGILESFLYDTVTARRDGRESTGNASRAGFKSAPKPAPTNLMLDPTGVTRQDVWRQAGRAFLVHDFHGVHSGANPVSGDFSVGATGRLLEDGALGAAVKEVTIAAPMLDILSRIVHVADDLRWLPFGGAYGGSTTLISEMTVAGS